MLVASVENPRMGSETSWLPEPMRSAVARCAGWKVPLVLREELAVWVQARETTEEELVGVLEALRKFSKPDDCIKLPQPSEPPPSLFPQEWQDRAHARANGVTAEAQKHRFFGLGLRNQLQTWRALRNSLREAVEAFAGHRGDSQWEEFEPESGGCDVLLRQACVKITGSPA
jgi:hypothetical protein